MTSQGSLSVKHQEAVRRPAGWPSDKPVWSLTVFFLAALVVPGRIIVEYAQHWSDLGSHYLPICGYRPGVVRRAGTSVLALRGLWRV
jgi:hypothetical protein